MKPRSRLGQATVLTARRFWRIAPVLIGVLALSTLAAAAIPPQSLAEIVPTGGVLGPLIATVIGSLASGHPLTSYVLGGELLSVGVGLATIAAFIVSWVTVGIVQLPAEAAALGLRFAVLRNAICFVFALMIAYLIPALISLVR